jgi:hypothetical protein
LVALVRRDAKARDSVVARAKQSTERRQKAFFDVLSSAGTPEAQQALGRFVTEKGAPVRARGSAAMSLIRVHEATPETVSLLERLVRDPELTQFGVFGLGTAARRLREAGRTDESNKIVAELATILERAPNDDARVEALRGIANSADGTLLGKVRPFLETDRSPYGVRQAAVEAVGRMRVSDADSLLADRIANDPSSDVRRAAASIAGSRDPSPTLTNALTRASTRDQDRSVRYGSVQTLVRWSKDRPELRAVLEDIAKNEREPKIQELARNAAADSPHPETQRPM